MLQKPGHETGIISDVPLKRTAQGCPGHGAQKHFQLKGHKIGTNSTWSAWARTPSREVARALMKDIKEVIRADRQVERFTGVVQANEAESDPREPNQPQCVCCEDEGEEGRLYLLDRWKCYPATVVRCQRWQPHQGGGWVG